VISKKIGTSVTLTAEIIEHMNINPHIKSLSAWIIERYTEEFLCLEKEMGRKNDLITQLKICERNLEDMKKQEEGELVSDNLKNWLNGDGKLRLKLGSIEGVFKYVRGSFEDNINLRQFRLLLDKMGIDTKK
tara:strand:+ start:17415 stop:17810 length:396 start_codon:yes stop_codon:yes gene_type:complete